MGFFLPRINLPHLYFQIYAFQLFIIFPLMAFVILLMAEGSLEISFKLLLMLVMCFLSFFSHEKFVNFMDLFKQSVFVSLILSMNLMFSILPISILHYFLTSASNPSQTFSKIEEEHF